jgi:superkiller protein 3
MFRYLKPHFLLASVLLNSLWLLSEAGRDPGSLRRSIQGLVDTGRLQEAQEKLNTEVTTHGESGDTLFLRGTILFKQKRFADSLKAAEQSLALGLRDAEVYKLVAFNGVILNRLDIVEPALNAALPLAPGDFTVHFHMGLLYFTTNRFAQAESQFRTVTELNPTYMRGYDMLGQAQEELEKDEAAVATYRKAIELTEQQNLKDESAYLHLAKFLWAKNRHQESLMPAQRAVAINPKSASAYYVLGRLLDELGRETEAVKALRQATEIDPELGESYYLLNRIYLRQGREEDAAKALSAFKASRSKTPVLDGKRITSD